MTEQALICLVNSNWSDLLSIHAIDYKDRMLLPEQFQCDQIILQSEVDKKVLTTLSLESKGESFERLLGFKADFFVDLSYNDEGVWVDGDWLPWKYTIIFENFEDKNSGNVTFHLTERIGGTKWYAGSEELGLVCNLPILIIDELAKELQTEEISPNLKASLWSQFTLIYRFPRWEIKIRLLLFITFLSQLFYFSVSNLKIPLPAKLVELWANSLLPQEMAIEIKSPRIIGMSKVDLGILRLRYKERVILDLDDILVSLQSSWSLDNPLHFLNSLKVSNAILFPEQNELNKFELSNFSINQRPNQNSIILRTSLRLAHIKNRLNLEIQSIDQILENHLIKEDPNSRKLEETIDSLIILKKNIFQFLQNAPAITTYISGKINEEHGEFHISQSSESMNENIGVKNLTSYIYLSDIDKNKTNFSFRSQADKVIHTVKTVKLDFNNLQFSGKGTVENENFTFSSVGAHLSYENLLLSGKLSGDTPPLDIYCQKKTIIFSLIYSQIKMEQNYLFQCRPMIMNGVLMEQSS